MQKVEAMKRSLTLAGVAMAILGWCAPWVTSTRQLVALTYNALDLTEFCKFISRAGIATITREWFLVPLIAAALALALWASQPAHLSAEWRYALVCLAVIFSLVPAPPYPYVLKAYASVEDRGPFWLSVAGLIGVVLIFVVGRCINGRWRSVMFIALALIGALPAAWEFLSRVLPAISTVYASPAMPAWGFFVTVMGFAVIIVGVVVRET